MLSCSQKLNPSRETVPLRVLYLEKDFSFEKTTQDFLQLQCELSVFTEFSNIDRLEISVYLTL
jgi:hypothetical protein